MIEAEDPPLHHDDVGLVNCGACRLELLGERTLAKLLTVPQWQWPDNAKYLFRKERVVACRQTVGGRVDMPLCPKCGPGPTP